MIPFAAPMLTGGKREPLVQNFVGSMSDTVVPRPSGATQVIIEIIGFGDTGGWVEVSETVTREFSGGGGAYARRTIPAPAQGLRIAASPYQYSYATATSLDSGVEVCRAQNGYEHRGGSGSASVGDVTYSGGAGVVRDNIGGAFGGGGAGGPLGPGAAGAFSSTTGPGGKGGGAPAGDGGSVTAEGVTAAGYYGGGGAYDSSRGSAPSGPSLIRLTWIF